MPYLRTMSEIDTLEPKGIIERRIALEEKGVETSELESELRGAVDLVSTSYVELLLTAQGQGIQAPCFSVQDNIYKVFATKIRHKHRWRGKWQGGYGLACQLAMEPDTEIYLFLTPRGLHAPHVERSKYTQPASHRILAGFAAKSASVLAQLDHSSHWRLKGAREGLESIDSLHLELTS